MLDVIVCLQAKLFSPLVAYFKQENDMEWLILTFFTGVSPVVLDLAIFTATLVVGADCIVWTVTILQTHVINAG